MNKFKPTYILPLLIYFISGASGITSVSSSFFVKDYISLSAASLAALGFWSALPWALKVPFGQLVDKYYHKKNVFIFIGSVFIFLSFYLIIGIISKNALVLSLAPPNSLFIFSSVIGQLGWVLQDVVADATTSEVVPSVDEKFATRDIGVIHQEHTYVQTLGRLSMIVGTIVGSLFNFILFYNTKDYSPIQRENLYIVAYSVACLLPIMVIIISYFVPHVKKQSTSHENIDKVVLLGSVIYAATSILLKVFDVPYNLELSVVIGVVVLSYLAARMGMTLTAGFKNSLFATAFLLFMFRATPSMGDGITWWSMDYLKFDAEFYSQLGVVSSIVSVVGLLLLKDKIAKYSLTKTILILTIAGVIFSLPIILMYFFNIHQYISNITNGLITARTLMFIDTAIASPFDHLSMIPVLAWIAMSSPKENKATWFALMSSIANLALQLGSVITSWINEYWVVEREVRDAKNIIITSANYSHLGEIMIIVILLSVIMPLIGIFIYNKKIKVG